MADKNDSHLSQNTKRGVDETETPLPMHHRAKLGEKVGADSNPFGAQSGPTDNKLANQGGKRW